MKLGLILLLMMVLCSPPATRSSAARSAGRSPSRFAGRSGSRRSRSLAAVPLIVLVALAFSDRGIGGTVSDRWHDLTRAEQSRPRTTPAG